jgi:Glycosyltransferases involved in cell wall biogenesis
LKSFQKLLTGQTLKFLFVNNGSQDNSKEVLNQLIPKHNFSKAITIDKNIGYGNGIISGLSEAKGEFLAYTHADLQTDPADLLKAFSIIGESTDPAKCFVKGNRKGRPFFDQFFTTGMSFFESIYLGKWLWDINAQPNVFHRNFFDQIKNRCPTDFSLDLFFLYMAKKNNLKIKRFNVEFPQRIHGKSSWNNGISSKWKFIKRTLQYSFKLKNEL